MEPIMFLTLQQIAESLPGARGAKHVSHVTITRWITEGVPSRATGQRVKLRATRAGHRWLVKEADLDEFFRALAGEPAPPAPPTPTGIAGAWASRPSSRPGSYPPH
jgi:hypothetical protein